MAQTSVAAGVTPGRLLRVVIPVLLFSGVVACTDGGASDQVAPSPSTVAVPNVGEGDVAAAQERATSYLVERLDAIDPLHLSTLYYLHRNFDIGAFSETGELSVSGLAAVESGSAPRWEYGDTREILGMGRLVDPDRREPPRRRPDNAEVEVLLGGLYCDARPLTDGDADLWSEEARKGGYDATHVLLAAAWATEIGCALEVVGGAIDEAAAIVRSEFESRYGDRPAAVDIDDLGLEQAVFLEYATGERVLTPAWVAAVLEAQLDDGGWALSPSERGALAETHWHPTALALWALSLYSGQAGDETWVRS